MTSTPDALLPPLSRESAMSSCPPLSRESDTAKKIIWRPVSLLRKSQKDYLKKQWSLRQGRNGARLLCSICSVEFPTPSIQVHHLNHNRTDNRLENLAPACQKCNDAERANWLRVGSTSDGSVITSVREKNMLAHTQQHEYAPASAEESERHAEMRPLWDTWIADKERGAFSISKTWKKANLAEYAVHALVRPDGTKGSSVTYRRYIREDIAGGILEIEYDEYQKPVLVATNWKPVRYIPKPAMEGAQA